MLLNNWHLLLPEIYLTSSLVFLLAYGLFLVKWTINKDLNIKGGKNNLLKKFNILCIITLIWVFILLFNLNIGQINIFFEITFINKLIKIIMLITTIIILFLALDYLSKYKIFDFEYGILILLSLLGLFLLVSTKDLLGMYLSIETISLSLYILVAIKKNTANSTEAGLKYFLLGALSSGLLLFGCSLIYYSTGLTQYDALVNLISLGHFDNALLIGVLFLLFALLFKLAAAPFHMWAPDVYEGAPTIVTIFLAITPKIGILYLLSTLLYGPFLSIFHPNLQLLLFISALLSIFVGTFGAIFQNRIVRLMAFSAIAHIGFILLGFATGSFLSIYSSFIYIIVYIIMSFNSFTFILSYFEDKKYIEDLKTLYLFWPYLAFMFAMSLFSIAGIPPLAGFFSKFYIFYSLISNDFIIVAIFAILLSVIASYYYLRIIQFMFFSSPKNTNHLRLQLVSFTPTFTTTSMIIMSSTFYFILTFLFYPKPLLLIVFDCLLQSL